MNFQAAPGSTLAGSENDSAPLDPAGSGHKFYSIPLPQLTLLHSAALARASRWSVSDAKRVMDIAGSAVALILLSPVLLFVALLVAYSSSGQVLFAQRRVGRLGQLFTIYKFRTMHSATHARGPGVTQCGDSRITPIGRILRKFKIDELPQFYNVLRGDMSLVGPRPKLPQHEGMHMPFRPGITGAATLAFRREEEMLQHIPPADLEFYYGHTVKPLKTQIDSQYMATATMLSDLFILFRTAAACVLPHHCKGLLSLNIPDPGSFDIERLGLGISDIGDRG